MTDPVREALEAVDDAVTSLSNVDDRTPWKRIAHYESQARDAVRALIAAVRLSERERIAVTAEDTELLLDVWHQFAVEYERNGEKWWGDSALSTLEEVAATLVERGKLEKHPTMDWYRAAHAQDGTR